MPRKRRTQPIQVPTGVPYGQGEKLADAQRALPLPQGSPPAAAQAGGTTAAAAGGDRLAAAIAAAQQMTPPAGGLAAPSGRPAEPVTAGLAIGAGPGPESLPIPVFTADDDTLLQLTHVYRLHPSPQLARLIEVVRTRATAQTAQRLAGRRARRGR